jgi:hypothetical protein
MRGRSGLRSLDRSLDRSLLPLITRWRQRVGVAHVRSGIDVPRRRPQSRQLLVQPPPVMSAAIVDVAQLVVIRALDDGDLPLRRVAELAVKALYSRECPQGQTGDVVRLGSGPTSATRTPMLCGSVLINTMSPPRRLSTRSRSSGGSRPGTARTTCATCAAVTSPLDAAKEIAVRIADATFAAAASPFGARGRPRSRRTRRNVPGHGTRTSSPSGLVQAVVVQDRLTPVRAHHTVVEGTRSVRTQVNYVTGIEVEPGRVGVGQRGHFGGQAKIAAAPVAV